MPGTVLSMQNILLGQRKVMQIRQRETLSHQRAIIHEVCLSSAQLLSPVIGNSVLHSVMFTLKNKNKEICKEKFELMYVQVKDVSNFKVGKKI